MIEPEPPRYSVVARLLHWTIAAMVFVMLPVGIAMTSEGFQEYGDELFILHKGLGSVLLALVAVRIVSRLVLRAPPAPSHWPPIQRRLAGLSHFGLYLLLVAMTVSGYVRTVGGGFPIELLDTLGIPPLIPEMPETADRMAVIHKFSAYALVGLVGVHVSAAMHSALVEKDGVMSRMWPPFGGGRSRGSGHG